MNVEEIITHTLWIGDEKVGEIKAEYLVDEVTGERILISDASGLNK